MAASSEEETIELSEAIRTILAESSSPVKGKSPCRKLSTPENYCYRTGSESFDSNKTSLENGQKYLTPIRNKKDFGDVQLTPLSRKSSILQRSLGSNYYSRSASPKKRRHSRDVIILRPPKKRAKGATPRVTSTSKPTQRASKLTPSESSNSSATTSTKGLSHKVLHTTPVSSLPKSKLSNASPADIKPDIAQINLQGHPLQSEGNNLSLTPSQLFFLSGGDDNLSAKEKEDILAQARYLNFLEQQQQGMVMGGVGCRLEGQQDVKEFKFGQGGLSLDVADQTSKISLVAKGNQDDSLTNITWLRRMSAPDLDPGTLKQLKQDPHKERPPYSYSALIQFAISSAPEGKLTLRDIYFWIETNFPYFRTAKLGWKNSIRHNLSLHKIFVREAPSGPGKPAYWTLRPGTVVRMPEHKVVVHDERVGAYHSACGLADNAVNTADVNRLTSNIMRDASGLPCLLPAPEKPGASVSPVLTSTPVVPRPIIKPSKRVPPILPKGTPPYTLVPLPIYFTTDPVTGQLIPASGENKPPGEAVPSMVGGECGESFPLAGKVSSFDLPGTSMETAGPSSRGMTQQTPTRRPKAMVEPSNNGLIMHNLGRTAMDSGYGSTDSSLGEENALQGLRDFRFSHLKSEGAMGKENALSSEFDLGLDVDDSLLKTPPKGTCPDWLSPIRGFGTPGLDSGFSTKDMDLNFTPFKTGFTPNCKMGDPNAPRQRMLSPRQQMLSPLNRNAPLAQAGGRSARKARIMTPRRFNPQQTDLADGLHNSSFEQMFGGVEFDVDPDSIDVGSMSWLLQTPPAAK